MTPIRPDEPPHAMSEKPLTYCKHCGARIDAWINDIPWCTTKKCLKRLYALLDERKESA